MAHDTKHTIPEGFHDLAESSFGGIGPSQTDSKDLKSEVHYPEIHFSGDHAEKLKKHLKEHGTATIHYKKISEGHRVAGDKHHHSVGIQIHGIRAEKAKGDDMNRFTSKESPSEDAIEKGLEAAHQELEND
jgi:hypothetical protein